MATADMRGHGESSAGWTSYSRTDIAGDLVALIRHLGGPAIILGASCSGAAAAIVAANEPDLVSAFVQLDPGTLKPKLGLSSLNPRYLKGMTLLSGGLGLKNAGRFGRYYRYAYPAAKPADFEDYTKALKANLREPGRLKAAAKAAFSSPADAEVLLPKIQCPALVIMGTKDPDFPDPRAEADAIVAKMPPASAEP